MGKLLFRFFTGMHAKLYKLTGGRFFGGGDKGSILVLAHKGARSGKLRDTPLMYFRDAGNYLIVASAGGDPRNPGWYHNLMANPGTTINVNGETVPVHARDAGSERDRLWQMIVATKAQFGAYETKTDRTIPVVVLESR
jgi:deazaflavin-dependent oxidoreductase (nitroreductase family)